MNCGYPQIDSNFTLKFRISSHMKLAYLKLVLKKKFLIAQFWIIRKLYLFYGWSVEALDFSNFFLAFVAPLSYKLLSYEKICVYPPVSFWTFQKDNSSFHKFLSNVICLAKCLQSATIICKIWRHIEFLGIYEKGISYGKSSYFAQNQHRYAYP